MYKTRWFYQSNWRQKLSFKWFIYQIWLTWEFFEKRKQIFKLVYWFKKKSVHGWKKWSANRKFCKKCKKSLIAIKLFEFPAYYRTKIKTWSVETAWHGALASTYQIVRKYFRDRRSADQLQWDGSINIQSNWIFRHDHCLGRWCQFAIIRARFRGIRWIIITMIFIFKFLIFIL